MSKFIYPGKLPDQCPMKTCEGLLRSRTSKRRSSELLANSTCPYRWIVECSVCRTTWHGCQFGCGHLERRNSSGGSDIKRHEYGRAGKWQTGIRAACPRNPNRDTIQKELVASSLAQKLEQHKVHKKSRLVEVATWNGIGNQHHHLGGNKRNWSSVRQMHTFSSGSTCTTVPINGAADTGNQKRLCNRTELFHDVERELMPLPLFGGYCQQAPPSTVPSKVWRSEEGQLLAMKGNTNPSQNSDLKSQCTAMNRPNALPDGAWSSLSQQHQQVSRAINTLEDRRNILELAVKNLEHLNEQNN